MSKRRKTYHLHVKVPSELQPLVDTDTLTISLGTHSKTQAERLKLALTARFDQALSGLRQPESAPLEVRRMVSRYAGPLSPARIRKLLRDYVKRDLDQFAMERATARPGNDYTVNNQLEALDVGLTTSREQLGMNRHVGFMANKVEHLLNVERLGPIIAWIFTLPWYMRHSMVPLTARPWSGF